MALVFLSCGQRYPHEKEIASQIEQMIKHDFHMDCYNAESVKGFDDVMSITEDLSKADYYLFIDFKRKGDFPISIFAHQEFALARAWGITEIIAFQQEGLESLEPHGMVSYLLVHPIPFTRDRLVNLVREAISSKGWNKDYSRNLVVSRLRLEDQLIAFSDHTGQSVDNVWFLHIGNHRKDRAAVDTLAILHSVTDETTGKSNRPDSSYLKWAGQMGFHKTIFPEDEAHFTAFALRVGRPGVFLHSAADVVRQPIISEPGRYRLEYRVFQRHFLPLRRWYHSTTPALLQWCKRFNPLAPQLSF
jgi:hypothetical protein